MGGVNGLVKGIQDMLCELRGLGHAILGNFVYIGTERVFHLQNHGHITIENDFPALQVSF